MRLLGLIKFVKKAVNTAVSIPAVERSVSAFIVVVSFLRS